MFHYLPAKNNKRQERLKLPYQEYIYTSIVLSHDIFDDLPAKIETYLHGNIQDMRRDFRHMAKRIRSLYNR